MFAFVLPLLVAPVIALVLCVRVERHRPALSVISVEADGTVRSRVAHQIVTRHAFDAVRTLRAGRLDIHLGWYGI